jgi:putative SOS response-associated peptidase YedK
MARWGLIPFWMKEKPKIPHINARAETVHQKPLFREAFAKRRCLIPATGFYEWQARDDGKQPYRFRRKDLEPFAFAGIWEFTRLGEEDILSACIIVGEPNPLAELCMTECRSCFSLKITTGGLTLILDWKSCGQYCDLMMRS